MLLNFDSIIKSVQRHAKGFDATGIEEAINSAMVDFVTHFVLPFMKRSYFVKIDSTIVLGPFSIYNEAAFTSKANIIRPIEGGLKDSNKVRVPFELRGEDVFLKTLRTATGSLDFLAMKSPVKYSATAISTNSNVADTDFPEYCKDAIAHATVKYLFMFKKDDARAKYYDDLYMLRYGPDAQYNALGDWGIDNVERQYDDAGVNLQSWL